MPDQAALEFHQKMAAGLAARVRADTQRIYGNIFRQLGLSPETEAKVLDILTQPQRELERQAFEAAQSGTLPVPPSPEAIRAQRDQQNQQLRSALGEAGYAAFDQYRTTLPDRLLIDAMNQQGANLSESQSQQLLQVLTESRQQVIGGAGTTQNLNSLPRDQAAAVIQQQQALLQQTVNNRVQNFLTPQQAAILNQVRSQMNAPLLKTR
jgi:hypothetical protein